LPLVVGDEEPGLEPEFSRDLGDAQLELGQGERSVVARITAAELVEVDPVHDLDPIAAGHGHQLASSRTAAIRSRGAIMLPVSGWPGSGSSTKGTAPSPTRFLSRAVAMTTAS